MRRAGRGTSSCTVWLLLGLLLPVPAASAPRPARVDTLDVHEVLRRERAALDSLLLPESTHLDTTGIRSAADSLDRGGAALLRARAVARAERHQTSASFLPFALTDYQRVDGFRLGMGGEASRGPWLRADAAGAYGFSSHDWAGRGGVEFGPRKGPHVRLAAADLATPFGPTPAGKSLGLLALVLGQDRRDYLRRRSYEIRFVPLRNSAGDVTLQLLDWREGSLQAATDFEFMGGGTPLDEPNPAVTDGTGRGGRLHFGLGLPTARLRGDVQAGVCGGPVGGDFQYNWQELRIDVEQAVPAGRLVLRLAGANVGGSPPVQAAAYLGGDATLRGYARLEFAGRQSASTQLEYVCGVDLLKKSRIPIVEKLHLQFIPFVDVGSTWGEVPVVEKSRGTLEGDWRSSAGLGLRRTLWLPGVEALRLDVMRRTDRGKDAWSAWLRVVPIE